MSAHTISIDDIVVASGQTNSNVLVARTTYRDADGLTIYAPATLPEVATLQVSDTEDGSSGWVNYQESGADWTVAAGKAKKIDDPVFKALRIQLGGAAGATRTFHVTKAIFA